MLTLLSGLRRDQDPVLAFAVQFRRTAWPPSSLKDFVMIADLVRPYSPSCPV